MALFTLFIFNKRNCRCLKTFQKFLQLNLENRIYNINFLYRSFFLNSYDSISISNNFLASISTSVNTNIYLSSNSKIINNEDKESSIIIRNEKDERRYKNEASILLQRIFGFDYIKADHWVKSYQSFLIIDYRDIENNYKACLDAGFKFNVIKDNVGMISYPNNILTNKIETINSMGIDDINNTVAFFHLGITKLIGFSSRLRSDYIESGEKYNRITYLSEKLECSQLQICNVMAKYYFMQTVLYTKLVTILKIMLDYNVSKEDILSDIWAFRYRPDVVNERLKRAVDAGVSPIKPWMIRCPELCLSRRIGKELSRRSVLGNEGTSVKYLSKRLGYDEKLLDDIFSKNAYLPQVSGPKMKKVIDFLFDNGYTKEHFIRVPRILLHKIDTMKKRLNELSNYGHKPKSLMVFCKSQREYEAYLNNVKIKWMARK